jgi:CMP-2-keto-3-deoxyoctulosonic acid synthetase
MLDNPAIQVVSLVVEIKDVAEVEGRNCIQVVSDHQPNEMCFSREPIPIRCKLAKFKMTSRRSNA